MDLFDLLKKFRASKTEEDDASVYDVFEVKDCWTARHWGVHNTLDRANSIEVPIE